jgi:hypothetical protein
MGGFNRSCLRVRQTIEPVEDDHSRAFAKDVLLIPSAFLHTESKVFWLTSRKIVISQERLCHEIFNFGGGDWYKR